MDFTAPGTVLPMGGEATVPATDDPASSAVALKVTGIERGKAEDLAAAGEGQLFPGATPYYVKVTVTNVSGADLAGHRYADGGDLGAYLDAGGPAATTGGTVGPCESYIAAPGFNAAGASYQTCFTAIAPAGRSITGAHYSGPVTVAAPAPELPNYALRSVNWTS